MPLLLEGTERRAQGSLVMACGGFLTKITRQNGVNNRVFGSFHRTYWSFRQSAKHYANKLLFRGRVY